MQVTYLRIYAAWRLQMADSPLCLLHFRYSPTLRRQLRGRDVWAGLTGGGQRGIGSSSIPAPTLLSSSLSEEGRKETK